MQEFSQYITMNINQFTWQHRLPYILVFFWLLFLGITIWQHALHSGQPPLYDPQNYILKAKHFWEAVELGRPFNPMNLDPTVRPPGTILMSYPFGFSDSFLGFYFRSVFLPILIVVVAIYMVAKEFKRITGSVWVAAIAVLFSTLPMFYHLDLADDTTTSVRWGLVDNFQASVAAMSIAAAIRSTMTKSLAWLLFGISLAAFTLLIKPSGLMVMALMALTWLLIVAYQWKCAARLNSSDPMLPAYALKGTIGFLIIYGCVITICVFSEYFSEQNFAFAKKALVTMVKELRITFLDLPRLFHSSSGEALPIWIMGVVGFFAYSYILGKKPVAQLQATALACLFSSLVIWVFGAWYWLVVQSGGSEIRYFYPFMMMGIVCIVPAALYLWPLTHSMVRFLFLALCFIPALNIAGLLMTDVSPSSYWQKLTGVNVSVGAYQEPARQAYTFLDAAKEIGKNATVYTFANGVSSITFENVLTFEKMIKPGQLVIRVVNPLDWVRGFAVRINEILESDYILITKNESQVTNSILRLNNFDSFEIEKEAFEAWLWTLPEKSGVKIVSDGRVLRLLRIVDTAALNLAIEGFVTAHTWRPEFIAANNKPLWWNADMVSAYIDNPAVEEIDFGGIFRLHALSIKLDDRQLKIEVWWEELRHEEANSQRMLFLHLVDSSGEILHNTGIALYPYAPFDTKRSWRHVETSFDLPASDGKLTVLEFGVFNLVNSQRLKPDKGQTDLDGDHILIQLKPFLHP
jgi:hypothetical protein